MSLFRENPCDRGLAQKAQELLVIRLTYGVHLVRMNVRCDPKLQG
jgi:hypothetical protein